MLRRQVHIAVVHAHLDPYLGFLHSVQQYKPSLIYDMMERWRAIIEDFLLNYHTRLNTNSFTKHGERTFLKKEEVIKMTKAIYKHIDKKRIRYNYRGN